MLRNNSFVILWCNWTLPIVRVKLSMASNRFVISSIHWNCQFLKENARKTARKLTIKGPKSSISPWLDHHSFADVHYLRKTSGPAEKNDWIIWLTKRSKSILCKLIYRSFLLTAVNKLTSNKQKFTIWKKINWLLAIFWSSPWEVFHFNQTY